MHKQMHQTSIHELAPPTCVLLLSKNFDPLEFFNLAWNPSLSIMFLPYSAELAPHKVMNHVFVQIPPYGAISNLCPKLSPFVINFHKRYSLMTKVTTRVDVDLSLAFFLGDTTICVGMTQSCKAPEIPIR